MHLDSYISDLLYRYDCVTIPEFGAFLTKQMSAKFDEDSQTFYPPKKLVSFNEQVQNNDGLLANYIADTLKVPYSAAVQKIQKQVRSIKSYLIEGETITFQNIGEISLNKDGKMLFEPLNHINYLTDSFGLSNFKTALVTREIHKKQVEKTEKVIPIHITPERRKMPVFLKYAAIAALALTVGGFGASAYYSNQIDNYNEIAQEKANKELDSKIQEATFVIDNPLPAATLKVDKQSGNYHIVAGAFRVQENSAKKVEQLRGLGYKAREIGINRYGLHEVVYSSYEDRLDALKALREIKRTQNSDAWLLVKRLDPK